MKNIRQLVVEALLKVDMQKAWSNLVLDQKLEKYDLSQRDGAFFAALFYGVLEREVTLDACVAAHSKTPVEKLSPAVREILRTGVYQLLYMDSVPDHAAVAESVELTRKLRKAQAAGFVNGVLRSFLRAGKAVPLPEAPPSAKLSVQFSCPEELVRLWLESYGEEKTLEFLKGSIGRAPLYIRVNTLSITAAELISRLTAHGVLAEPDRDIENCLRLENGGAVYALPEYKRGFFHVQDKASQIASLMLGAKPGERVMDACAAPGGKSFTIAQLMGGEGEIVACDLHEHRTGLITSRAKKMGLKSVVAKTCDSAVYNAELGAFDKVLCDVPCSGLGVIRRKPEIKRKKMEHFSQLPDLQYKILESASKYCKPGGRVLYTTCTLNPAENEAVVRRLLNEHPGFAAENLPGEEKSMRTFFGEGDTDGFFIAALVKEN